MKPLALLAAVGTTAAVLSACNSMPMTPMTMKVDNAALPEPSKTYVYHRLLKILSADEPEPDFESLAAADRQAILEILLETKSGLPQEWLDYAQHRGTHP